MRRNGRPGTSCPLVTSFLRPEVRERREGWFMKSEALCKTPSGDLKISLKDNIGLKGVVREKPMAEVTKVRSIKEWVLLLQVAGLRSWVTLNNAPAGPLHGSLCQRSLFLHRCCQG